MNTATIRRFLILLSSEWEAKRVGLYQLVSLAERYYLIKDIGSELRIGQILQEFPSPFNQIGAYYEALYLHRSGEFENASKILEKVADQAPQRYRAKALLSMGAIEHSKGNYDETARLKSLACKEADPFTLIEAHRGIAVARSLQGDNKWALSYLEKHLPLALKLEKNAIPYDYLNSFAVELAEAGRLKEAENVCRIVLASPYAPVYPEWRETDEGIALKSYRLSRSTVAVALKPIPSNVVSLPDREIVPTPQDEPASIRSLQDWKKKMVKERNGNKKDEKVPEKLDDRQMLLKVVQLSTTKGLPDEALQEMVDALEKIVKKYTNKDDKDDKKD